MKKRKAPIPAYWLHNVDHPLEFNERPISKSAERISAGQVKHIAHERYEVFDEKRRQSEAQATDAEDIQALEDIESIEKAKRQDSEQ